MSWYFLPFWLFLCIGFYLYLVPLFRPGQLFFSFFVLLAVAWFATPSIWLAIFLSVLFFFVLGIKDLFFIRRVPAYEVFALLMLFLVSLNFFGKIQNWTVAGTFLAAFLMGILVFFLFRGFIRYKLAESSVVLHDKRLKNLILRISAFLMAEFTAVIIFLPLNFLYQGTLLFLLAAFLLETLPDYLFREFNRTKFLVNVSLFFACVVLILSSAQWGL